MNNRITLISKISLSAICITFSLPVLAQQQKKVSPVTTMEKNFLNVPAAYKLGTYWYWLSDNISEEGVTKDLESMAEVGIGRAFIGNIGLAETPYGKVKLFSQKWWDVTKQTMKTAARVGVDIGSFNSPGWSQSGGPWVKPTEAMRYLASTETRVTGPKVITQKLPTSGKDFQDVSVLAFPAPDERDISTLNPQLNSNISLDNIQNLADGNIETTASFSADILKKKAVTINIKLPETFTARSLLLYPSQKPILANVELEVKTNDGFKTIKKFEFARFNPGLLVGFIPYGPVAISFSAVTGNEFRLIFTDIDSEAGGLAEIKLSSEPYVERYIEKQLGKMFQTPQPLWNEYQWKQQPETGNEYAKIDPAKVINITSSMATDGTLTWNVPKGDWIIVRYGMRLTGVPNSPATPEGTGIEVDKMNKDVLDNHFKSFIGRIQDSLPAASKKAFKYVIADSYETGSQNWTDDLAGKFKKHFGYDPTPWLPVLTGRIVSSADQSDRFLWDLRRIIADKVAYEYVGGLRDISHKHGMSLWLENYGHWGYPSEFLMYGGQSDEVGGEFWNESTLGTIELKAASSAAHIYGKSKVSAESFTAGGLTYARYPALLKKRGDYSFTEGINNTVLHVYVMQPYEDKDPGVNAWFGTEFNRKNTWFKQGKAFIDYIRRCNYILQQGMAINDVIYFIGEDAPKMTGIKDPELPKGYGYDYINAEVIETRLSVKNGRLVLPNGVSYRILVLPKLETMRPELLIKIKELVSAGAVVLGPKPTRSPSLQNYTTADRNINAIAKELWGNVDGVNIKSGRYGKGMIFSGMTMEEALAKINVKPDFYNNTDQPVLYTHRTNAKGEIYFVTNQSEQAITLAPRFRVTGKQPEWWDAVTGSTRVLKQFTQTKDGITIPLKLDALQSGFVIFNKPLSKVEKSNSVNFPSAKVLTTIKTPWAVTFDKAKRGPAEPIIFNELKDWTENTDEHIKNYSGTAVYKTSFNMSALPANGKVFLNVGKINVMGKVKLNGKYLGTVWTPPYQVDATGILKQGKNELEIEVVNTWVNRLIGDAKLPAAERKTYISVSPYTADSAYQPAGLIGPVTVQEVKY